LGKKPTAPRAKAKPVRWQIIKRTGTPAKLLAIVEAPDEVPALQAAAEFLELRSADIPRLIVRRA
jgi:hypothetical protein